MNDATRALAGYRMERAREALTEAGLLLDAGHLNTCVNRLYYACFYAVSALLVMQGISTSKHGHLRSLLHRDFVKTGLIPAELGRHFDRLFSSRQEGDYADFVVFKVDEIRPWLDESKAFVDYVEKLITRVEPPKAEA
ncbi:MAG: HEPN domain-containing protein [Phycisphaerales bacterium]